ncbi:protocadherin beta-2-like [Argonauta hians]
MTRKNDYFAINNITGQITVIGSIVTNRATFYEFTVEASDGHYHNSQAKVIINVNHNIYPPVFAKPYYEVDVPEYTPLDTKIIQVTATDKDITTGGAMNNELAYYLSPPNSYFTISKMGNIYIRESLATNSTGDQVNLTVIASDQSPMPKSASTVVIVNILRNTYAPVLIPSRVDKAISSTFNRGQTILKLTVEDKDKNSNFRNPNGEVTLTIPDKYINAKRYFDVTNDGELYLKKSLFKTASHVYQFKVIAKDRGWNSRSSEAEITINVTQVIQPTFQLGFTQSVYQETIPENKEQNALILSMGVENVMAAQDVTCEIQGGNNAGYFSVSYDQTSASCLLKLSKGIDYESAEHNYILNIAVYNSLRRKLLTFKTYSTANVYITVTDVNEFSPEFVPNYYYYDKIYFGLLSSTAGINSYIMTVNATDKDINDRPYLSYSFETSTAMPFYLRGNSIFNNDVYKKDDPTNYYFDVKATDRNQKSGVNKAVINIVFNFNRYILRYFAKPSVAATNHRVIENALANLTNKIVLLESTQLAYNDVGRAVSDIIFVLAEKKVPYRLIYEISDDTIRQELNKFGNKIDKIDSIITRFEPQTVGMSTKSYIWWMDDPWAALVALAAIIILLCLIGIIVILFTWSRYTKYLNQYRIHHLANEPTDFEKPPSFLTDFETQSLNMYVPPDEAERDLGEINMTFEGDTLRRVEHQGADPGVASAVNPLFNNHQPQDIQQKTGSTETTTML